jgi:serine/threonine-protein kinase
LVWVDRKGAEEPIPVPLRRYAYAQLSPDGTRAVLDSREEEQDIWVWNFARAALQRLTFAAERAAAPVWSRDGQRVAFARDAEQPLAAEAGRAVYWRAADGSGVPELLVRPSTKGNPLPTGFSPDGKTLLYGAAGDVWMIPIGSGPDAAVPLLSTPANERNAVVSPNGRWLAYESDESGEVEVHVRQFPDVKSGHWQVSTGGGTHPLWSRDGKELFYYAPATPSALMVVHIDADASRSLAFGRPERLFQTTYPGTLGGNQTYDVSLDGKRFLMIRRANRDETRAGLVVVQNWFGELKRHVATE